MERTKVELNRWPVGRPKVQTDRPPGVGIRSTKSRFSTKQRREFYSTMCVALDPWILTETVDAITKESMHHGQRAVLLSLPHRLTYILPAHLTLMVIIIHIGSCRLLSQRYYYIHRPWRGEPDTVALYERRTFSERSYHHCQSSVIAAKIYKS